MNRWIIGVAVIAASVAVLAVIFAQAAPRMPVTIIDDMDKSECSLAHNIQACFVGGQPPADIPISEYAQLFMMARDDLSQRTGADIGLIKLASIERVQWSDTSLGSPQPGMMYAQVIVPGFRMVLEAEGKRYLYHTSTYSVAFIGQR